MISKNLFVGINIAIQIKWWYLVGVSRWEKVYVHDLLFGVNTILNNIDTRVTSPRHEGFLTCNYTQMVS